MMMRVIHILQIRAIERVPQEQWEKEVYSIFFYSTKGEWGMFRQY